MTLKLPASFEARGELFILSPFMLYFADAGSDAAHKPSSAALAAVPAALWAELTPAMISGHLHQISTIIERVREYDVKTADTLACLAKDFEYEEILTVIRQTRNEEN